MTISAYSASDGTLRFLAMLAALLGANAARLYVFEEIDNGIHPSRQQLLIDLIEGQTAKGNYQVVTTTHSPDLIELVGADAFESTSVVCRCPDTDDAEIRAIAELPNANKLMLMHTTSAPPFDSADSTFPRSWCHRCGFKIAGAAGRRPRGGRGAAVPDAARGARSRCR